MQSRMILNTKAYSIVIALTMIGFLLLVVVWVLNLVLRDLKDNNGIGDAMKAYFWAEASQELALLKIKQSGYGFYDTIPHTINLRSIVLADFPKDTSRFNPTKDVYISYDLWTNVSEYSGSLSPLGYDMIPLFYLVWNDIEHKAVNISSHTFSQDEGDLVWNIVSESGGISWTGSFDMHTQVAEKVLIGDSFSQRETSIENYLRRSWKNYLILFNANNKNIIDYNIASLNPWEYFSQPKTTIIASAQVWKYKQNVSTMFNNTQYLDTLKYSIYSN